MSNVAYEGGHEAGHEELERLSGCGLAFWLKKAIVRLIFTRARCGAIKRVNERERERERGTRWYSLAFARHSSVG